MVEPRVSKLKRYQNRSLQYILQSNPNIIKTGGCNCSQKSN